MAARVGQFAAPSQIDPNYPKDLEAILLKALDIDKTQRYQTALEFKMALDNCASVHQWYVNKDTWRRELSQLMGSQPTPVPRMCAAEVPNDPNTIISHKNTDYIEVEDDSECTIQLRQKSLVEELRKLSLKSTASLPAIPCEVLEEEIEKHNAEKEAERQEASAQAEQEPAVKEENASPAENPSAQELAERRHKKQKMRILASILVVVFVMLLVLWLLMIMF